MHDEREAANSSDERGARASANHGMGPEKRAAFILVPNVIKSGEITLREPDKDGKPIENVFVTASIEINGEPYVMAIRLRKDVNATRFYVHEVEIKKSLQNFSKPEPGNPSDHGGFGAVWNILRQKSQDKQKSLRLKIDRAGNEADFINTEISDKRSALQESIRPL